MTGEIIGGFKLGEKLGEGGTGETYLAEHGETGQKAAVKVLFPALCADKDQIDRFLAEARAASQVNHIGIADLYDSGVHASGRAVLVMEYVTGKTLTQALIESGSVSDVASLADVGWQLATILQAAHASKLVHGALKPDGIYLTFPPQCSPRPLVKLFDFGLAKFTLGVRNSQTGSLLGAPLYMSPEIARGVGAADHRADIYSLGCILFEMACGRPPFVREGKGELIIAHATEPAPPVSSLDPSIPQAIDTLIGRMLTKNPAARPQTMTEVASVLGRFFNCPAPALAQPAASAGRVAQVSPAAPVPPVAPATVPPAAPVAAFSQAGRSTGEAPAVHVPPSASPQVTKSQVTALYAPARPTGATAPVAEGPSKPRQQEPTTLLPPEPRDLPAQAKTEYLPDAKPAWLERVRERTAILEPPSAPKPRTRPSGPKPVGSSRPSGPKPAEAARRSKPEPGSGRAASASRPGPRRGGVGIDVPVVVVSALAVLAIALAVLAFMSRKPAATARSAEAGKTPSGATAEAAKSGPKSPRRTPAAQLPSDRAEPLPPPSSPPAEEAAEGGKPLRRREFRAPGSAEPQGPAAPRGRDPSFHW